MDTAAGDSRGAGPGTRRDLSKRISTIGWGLFFIWLGFVLMIKAGPGLILLGVGIISLGMQVVRKYVGLDSDGFWIVVAVLFIVVGLWEMIDTKLPLMSMLLIVIGGAFLVSAMRGKGRNS